MIKKRDGIEFQVIPGKESKLEYIQQEKERILSEEQTKKAAMSFHTPLIFAQVAAFKRAYEDILDTCVEKHKAPYAYFKRAQLHFRNGLNMNCIHDLRKLLEITPPDLLTEEILKKLDLYKATAESELALFSDAILTLSTYLKNHPRHKEAYIDRAIAYLEAGDFHSAIQGFVHSGKKLPYIEPNSQDYMELAGGLIEGIMSGAGESLVDFVPGMLSSVQGLSNGLWAFVTSPNEVSRQLITACNGAIEFIQTQGFTETIKTLCPEIRELIEGGRQLSYQRQGELIGYLIGRHGVDFLLLAGLGKGIHVYRDLRHANAILSLEKMALSAEKGLQLEALHHQWWQKTKPVIDELKANNGRIGQDLYKLFKDHPLAENQIRQILHQAGFKTFPRPKGLPYEWKVEISKKGGGMKYRLDCPGKDGTPMLKAEVRVMPGDPSAKWASMRQPYVKHSSNGSYLDKYGRVVNEHDAAAHIPLHEYNFEKLSMLVPYE